MESEQLDIYEMSTKWNIMLLLLITKFSNYKNSTFRDIL